MRTQINWGRGKLYRADDAQLVSGVKYQIHEEHASEVVHWWGEFTFTGNVNAQDNTQYIIELEDGRKGKCHIKKLVNRVARGVPPRYLHHFTGTSPLE